ncbi:unnamed protein product [Lepidochelys kempii]
MDPTLAMAPPIGQQVMPLPEHSCWGKMCGLKTPTFSPQMLGVQKQPHSKPQTSPSYTEGLVLMLALQTERWRGLVAKAPGWHPGDQGSIAGSAIDSLCDLPTGAKRVASLQPFAEGCGHPCWEGAAVGTEVPH